MMDRSHGYVVIMTVWVLWQELLLPHTSSPPSWHFEGRFSEEGPCQEARKLRINEQLLRAGNDGATIINQPTIEEGMVWRQEPNGHRTRIRFYCLPETINPEGPWFGGLNLDPSLRTAMRFSSNQLGAHVDLHQVHGQSLTRYHTIC
jgi:hypothetical protein